jgi:hypothetical protein
MLVCEGVDSPYYHPSLSMPPQMLGQHNIEFSLLIPLAMNHPKQN